MKRVLSYFSFSQGMEEAMKSQRAIIFFLWKEGTSGNDIVRRLSAVFGEHALHKTAVYKWMQRFEDGRESLEDDPRSGRPATTTTQENIDSVENILQTNRRITIREVASITGISLRQLHEIITNNLQMRKLTARWVPRLLTTAQRNNRVEACKELLRMSADIGESFWDRLITEDETWLPHYLPETKLQSRQWCRVGEHPPVKPKSYPSAKKTMITVFWDCKGVILIDYLEQGRTINSAYYCDLLRNDLRTALKNRRRGKLSASPILQHDNARPHTAALTLATVQELGWTLIPHPPYSPDLAPSDYHLFSELKKPLRGKHFHTAEEMKEAVDKWVKETPADFFSYGIRSLRKRWEKCVSCAGDYIEKFADDSCDE